MCVNRFLLYGEWGRGGVFARLICQEKPLREFRTPDAGRLKARAASLWSETLTLRRLLKQDSNWFPAWNRGSAGYLVNGRFCDDDRMGPVFKIWNSMAH